MVTEMAISLSFLDRIRRIVAGFVRLDEFYNSYIQSFVVALSVEKLCMRVQNSVKYEARGK